MHLSGDRSPVVDLVWAQIHQTVRECRVGDTHSEDRRAQWAGLPRLLYSCFSIHRKFVPRCSGWWDKTHGLFSLLTLQWCLNSGFILALLPGTNLVVMSFGMSLCLHDIVLCCTAVLRTNTNFSFHLHINFSGIL